MDIPANNSLKRIHLEAETEELPDIDYTYLTDCEVLVQDNLFEQMLLTDGKAFSPESGNTLAKASAPDTMYMVSGGMVYTKEGKLGAVVGAGSSLKLTTAIKSIGENAFALSSDLDTLVIPKEMTILTLDKDCFAGSNIKRVLCSTQTQVDMLSKQLADSGAPGRPSPLAAHNDERRLRVLHRSERKRGKVRHTALRTGRRHAL